MERRNTVVAARKHPLLVLLLWLAGATAAFAISVLCWTIASDGKLNAVALVPFVWTVALFAGAVRAVPAALPAAPWSTALAWQLALQRAGSGLLALLQHAEHNRPHEAQRQRQENARPDGRGDRAGRPQRSSSSTATPAPLSRIATSSARRRSSCSEAASLPRSAATPCSQQRAGEAEGACRRLGRPRRGCRVTTPPATVAPVTASTSTKLPVSRCSANGSTHGGAAELDARHGDVVGGAGGRRAAPPASRGRDGCRSRAP